jgi:hypothetical protein
MAAAVEAMKEVVAGDKETFDLVQRRVELAKAAVDAARAKVELHRSEHGC